MNQTRLGSLIEALFNVAIGFAINMLANMVILPLVGFHITLGQNLFIGLLYTVVSVARSYVIRLEKANKVSVCDERGARQVLVTT